MTLDAIENEYGFKYPELYRKLEEDGMLNVGEYGPDWYRTVFPKIKDTPTLLLHSSDFELLNIKDAYEALQELSDPEGYRQIRPEFKFVPFGQNGAGDQYCFFLTEQDGDDIPIVFVRHDLNEVEYLAKNLQDYMFSVLLTDMSAQDTFNNLSDEDFRRNLKNTLQTHLKYLTSHRAEILQNVFSREIIDYEVELPGGLKEKFRGLLTNVELNEILSKVMPYDKLTKTFKYSAD